MKLGALPAVLWLTFGEEMPISSLWPLPCYCVVGVCAYAGTRAVATGTYTDTIIVSYAAGGGGIGAHAAGTYAVAGVADAATF